MASTKTKTIKVNYLTRVEGEGGLYVKYRGQEVLDVQLQIYEPPRFYESFLRGRKFSEAPDITSRICGICPIAYQMSSMHAMENAVGVTLQGPHRELRRLAYCGEWIESHGLHIFMLHAPDFFGLHSGIELAKQFPDIVNKGLQLKKIGNEIMTLVGGREIHPVNFKVGGFYRSPTKAELLKLKDQLVWGRDVAVEAAHWVSKLNFPNYEEDYEFVSLSHPSEYPINEGRIISNRGLNISMQEYEDHFEEKQVPHSTALQSVIKGRGAYQVGPLARFNLCYDQFSPLVKQVAESINFKPVCNNPFKSIIARTLEVLYCFDESLRIIDNYTPPTEPYLQVPVKSATGQACTEAPRGMIYHRYAVDADGLIEHAKIVPPTSQNQLMIELDLKKFIQPQFHLSKTDLEMQCERMVRNYDPCISCSAHFLKLKLEEDTTS